MGISPTFPSTTGEWIPNFWLPSTGEVESGVLQKAHKWMTWSLKQKMWTTLRIIGPSKLAILRTLTLRHTGSNPFIGGSKILRVHLHLFRSWKMSFVFFLQDANSFLWFNLYRKGTFLITKWWRIEIGPFLLIESPIHQQKQYDWCTRPRKTGFRVGLPKSHYNHSGGSIEYGTNGSILVHSVSIDGDTSILSCLFTPGWLENVGNIGNMNESYWSKHTQMSSTCFCCHTFTTTPQSPRKKTLQNEKLEKYFVNPLNFCSLKCKLYLESPQLQML